MFNQLMKKLKRNTKRQKVADYLEHLLDRVHDLDRQEDNIASERLFIERQVPRLREQLRIMDLGPVELKVAANMSPEDVRKFAEAFKDGKPIVPQPGNGSLA